jgi:hypothetical protein
MNPITITVYLQALGGKFLGPNAYNNNEISIGLYMNGQTLPFTYDAAGAGIDDGIIGQTFSNGSPYALPILTLETSNPNNPYSQYQVNYLTTDTNTVTGMATAQIPDVPVAATITAYIPRPTGLTLEVTQQIILVPQQTDYTFIIPVPGLLLESNPAAPSPGTVSVLVKMMCGCQISINKSNSFWSPDDFDVNATITFTDGTVGTYPMNFDSSSNDSAFYADIPGSSDIASVCYTAQQHSTGNFGYLEVLG